jgi:hypothetical protein
MKSYPDIIKQFLVHQKPYYIEVGNEREVFKLIGVLSGSVPVD